MLCVLYIWCMHEIQVRNVFQSTLKVCLEMYVELTNWRVPSSTLTYSSEPLTIRRRLEGLCFSKCMRAGGGKNPLFLQRREIPYFNLKATYYGLRIGHFFGGALIQRVVLSQNIPGRPVSKIFHRTPESDGVTQVYCVFLSIPVYIFYPWGECL